MSDERDVPQIDEDDVDAHGMKEAIAVGAAGAAIFAGSAAARTLPVDPGQSGSTAAAQSDHTLAGKQKQKKQKKQAVQRQDGVHGAITE